MTDRWRHMILLSLVLHVNLQLVLHSPGELDLDQSGHFGHSGTLVPVPIQMQMQCGECLVSVKFGTGLLL